MSDEQTAVDMEQYFQQGLDDQRATEAEKELLPPTDTYVSTPPLVVQATMFEEKEVDGKVIPARVVFTAFGALTGRKTGKVIRERIRFSPDMVKFVGDDGSENYDRASKNYLLLRKAYAKVFGVNPTTVADIKAYLEQYPIGIRGGQFDGRDGPAWGIFNIFPVTN